MRQNVNHETVLLMKTVDNLSMFGWNLLLTAH